MCHNSVPSERELAIEILKNCAAQYINPLYWGSDPQKIIDGAIDKAAKILAARAAEASPSAPKVEAAPMKEKL